MTRKTRSKKKGISIDFEGVESGGSRIIPDGTYQGIVHKCEAEESSSENQMLAFRWKISGGKYKGATVFDNCVLLPQSLWRLRSMLEACGLEVPDGAMDIDPDDLVDLECTLEITNEEYNGKDRPRITGFAPSAGEEEDEEEDEEDEEDDEEEEEAPKKKARKPRGKKAVVEEEEDEEDEEDEEAPKKKSKASSKKKASGKKKPLREGSKVKFTDEDGDIVKGVIVDIDGDDVIIEDADGGEWEVEIEELTAI